MMIDEAIENEKELSEHCKRMFEEMSAEDKLANKLLKSEIQYHEQLAEWLEELKDYRDKNKMVVRIDCINSEEFNDFAVKLAKEQYNKAIDDLVCKIEEHKTKGYVTGITYNPFEFGACQMADDIIKIAEQLKAGGENDTV